MHGPFVAERATWRRHLGHSKARAGYLHIRVGERYPAGRVAARQEEVIVADSPERGWTLLTSEAVFTNSYVTAYQNEYETTDRARVSDYFVVERNDFVLIVAQSAVGILLVRQYRPATNRFYWSVPAGYIEPDETPQCAGIRELREETGYSAQHTRVVAELHPLPGYVRSRAFVLLCDCVAQQESAVDSDEIDALWTVPWNKALSMIVSGEIDEMQTVAAILLARQVVEPHEP